MSKAWIKTKVTEVRKMCGRYTLTKVTNLLDRFNIEEINPTLEPRYNIAPTQRVPVIIKEKKLTLKYFQWGLIPHWSKTNKGMINARAETIDQKSAFKGSFIRRRCIIPADGFYEWKNVDNKKVPYWITLKSRELFAFAGIWREWKNSEREKLATFAIITTEPNDLIKPIHNRMPVILSKKNEEIWLDMRAEPSFLKNILTPYPSHKMTHCQVSAKVNNPKNDDSGCIEIMQSLW